MPKPNYAFEKRQRELEKQRKKTEKAQRKTSGAAGESSAEPTRDASLLATPQPAQPLA